MVLLPGLSKPMSFTRLEMWFTMNVNEGNLQGTKWSYSGQHFIISSRLSWMYLKVIWYIQRDAGSALLASDRSSQNIVASYI